MDLESRVNKTEGHTLAIYSLSTKHKLVSVLLANIENFTMAFQRTKFRLEGEVELCGAGSSVRWLIILFICYLIFLINIGCSLQVYALHVVFGLLFIYLLKNYFMRDTYAFSSSK